MASTFHKKRIKDRSRDVRKLASFSCSEVHTVRHIVYSVSLVLHCVLRITVHVYKSAVGMKLSPVNEMNTLLCSFIQCFNYECVYFMFS